VTQSSTTAKFTTGNVEHNAEVDVGFRCNTRVVEVDIGMKNIEKNIDINIARVKNIGIKYFWKLGI
jgi:hypothetical protein